VGTLIENFNICIAWLRLHKRFFFQQTLQFLLLIDVRKGEPNTLKSSLLNWRSHKRTKIILMRRYFLEQDRLIVFHLPRAMCAPSGGARLTRSGTRALWLAGHHKSSWRRRATLQCWACRRWGCRQLRNPHPGNASSRPPRARGDSHVYSLASNWTIRCENTKEVFQIIWGGRVKIQFKNYANFSKEKS